MEIIYWGFISHPSFSLSSCSQASLIQQWFTFWTFTLVWMAAHMFSMDYHTLFPWMPRNGSKAIWGGLTSSEHLFPHTRADLDKWQFSDLVEMQTFRANVMPQEQKTLAMKPNDSCSIPRTTVEARTSSHKQSSDHLMCTMSWWRALLWFSMTRQGKYYFTTG